VYEYDGANRHLAVYAPNSSAPRTAVTYRRDVTDRLIARDATVREPIVHRATVSAGTGAVAASSLAIGRPAGTVPGDVMVAALVVDGGSGVTVTAPTGWVLARSQVQGTSVRTSVFTKVAGSAEPASYTFSFSAARKAVGSISGYGGVDPVSPVEVSAGSGSATAVTALSGTSRLRVG